jgi:hypothetical protein
MSPCGTEYHPVSHDKDTRHVGGPSQQAISSVQASRPHLGMALQRAENLAMRRTVTKRAPHRGQSLSEDSEPVEAADAGRTEDPGVRVFLPRRHRLGCSAEALAVTSRQKHGLQGRQETSRLIRPNLTSSASSGKRIPVDHGGRRLSGRRTLPPSACPCTTIEAHLIRFTKLEHMISCVMLTCSLCWNL